MLLTAMRIRKKHTVGAGSLSPKQAVVMAVALLLALIVNRLTKNSLGEEKARKISGAIAAVGIVIIIIMTITGTDK